MKILISPGFGAGWSTWVHGEVDSRVALTWQPLIEFIEKGGDREALFDPDHPAIEGLVDIYPDLYVSGNVLQLKVVDIPTGTRFFIDEYDGSETVQYDNGPNWITAT